MSANAPKPPIPGPQPGQQPGNPFAGPPGNPFAAPPGNPFAGHHPGHIADNPFAGHTHAGQASPAPGQPAPHLSGAATVAQGSAAGLTPRVSPAPANGPTVVRDLGGFVLVRELGEGGMGKVFLARQTSLDRLVALKVLLPELSQDAEFLTRFLREARSAALFQHTNVVSVIDAGLDERYGVHYIAFEFIEGGSLEDLLQKQPILPEEQALLIIHGVLEALAFAESKGIIHRDVKPDNILICVDGTPKLADLGLAKKAEGGHESSVTQTGVVLGTPLYMAPEQALSEGELDIRVDLYALGLCLWRMVTGVLPFNPSGTLSSMQILTKHINEELENPRQINAQVSDATAKVIGWLSAREPENRYSSALQALSDVNRVLEGHDPLGPGAEAAAASSSGTKVRSGRLGRPLVTAPAAQEERTRPAWLTPPLIVGVLIAAVGIGVGAALASGPGPQEVARVSQTPAPSPSASPEQPSPSTPQAPVEPSPTPEPSPDPTPEPNPEPSRPAPRPSPEPSREPSPEPSPAPPQRVDEVLLAFERRGEAFKAGYRSGSPSVVKTRLAELKAALPPAEHRKHAIANRFVTLCSAAAAWILAESPAQREDTSKLLAAELERAKQLSFFGDWTGELYQDLHLVTAAAAFAVDAREGSLLTFLGALSHFPAPLREAFEACPPRSILTFLPKGVQADRVISAAKEERFIQLQWFRTLVVNNFSRQAMTRLNKWPEVIESARRTTPSAKLHYLLSYAFLLDHLDHWYELTPAKADPDLPIHFDDRVRGAKDRLSRGFPDAAEALPDYNHVLASTHAQLVEAVGVQGVLGRMLRFEHAPALERFRYQKSTAFMGEAMRKLSGDERHAETPYVQARWLAAKGHRGPRVALCLEAKRTRSDSFVLGPGRLAIATKKVTFKPSEKGLADGKAELIKRGAFRLDADFFTKRAVIHGASVKMTLSLAGEGWMHTPSKLKIRSDLNARVVPLMGRTPETGAYYWVVLPRALANRAPSASEIEEERELILALVRALQSTKPEREEPPARPWKDMKEEMRERRKKKRRLRQGG